MIIRCTKEEPWDGKTDPGDRVMHVDAREVGDQEGGWPSGDVVVYECPHCGHRWRAELPQ